MNYNFTLSTCLNVMGINLKMCLMLGMCYISSGVVAYGGEAI